MKAFNLCNTTTALLTGSALFLGLTTAALAGKGGKGGGNGGGGGEDPAPDPGLISAPVEYQITWLDWPEPLDGREVYDINSSGYAVGRVKPSATGSNLAILADSDGNLWDLNDRSPDGLFADALMAFPGWRFNTVEQITADGDFAGTLVPESEPTANGSNNVLIVMGNIYDPSLTAVDEIENNAFNVIADLTESGDLVLRLRWPEVAPGTSNSVLYYYPDAISAPVPQQIEAPLDAETGIWYDGELGANDSGQVTFTAEVTTYTTSTRGKKTTTTETTAMHTFLSEPNGDLLDLGVTHAWSQVSEDGSVYSAVNGIPSRWSPATQSWEAVAPGGSVWHVSKSALGEEVLINDGYLADVVWYVYKRDLGAFEVTVTSGFSGPGDVSDLYGCDFRYLQKISQPTASGYGHIAGYGGRYVDGAPPESDLFILTPIPVQP